jgi:uncharacterized damage-inducible protein DinB
MKETLRMYARYSERANRSVVGIIEGLPLEDRNANRGAYYGSLSGLVKHLLDGTVYFHSLFRASRPGGFAPSEAIASVTVKEGPVDDAEWKALKADLALADAATIDLVSSLDASGLAWPVKIDWYGGKPPDVPLHFLFNQMIVHGIHHRGQISQVLDEMRIEHDFSGIDLEYLC